MPSRPGYFWKMNPRVVAVTLLMRPSMKLSTMPSKVQMMAPKPLFSSSVELSSFSAGRSGSSSSASLLMSSNVLEDADCVLSVAIGL